MNHLSLNRQKSVAMSHLMRGRLGSNRERRVECCSPGMRRGMLCRSYLWRMGLGWWLGRSSRLMGSAKLNLFQKEHSPKRLLMQLEHRMKVQRINRQWSLEAQSGTLLELLLLFDCSKLLSHHLQCIRLGLLWHWLLLLVLSLVSLV